MTFTVWAPLLLPLLAAPLARRLSEHLPPRAAAWVLAGTAVALAAATAVSLALITATGLLRLPYVAALGHLSPHWLPTGSPYPPLAAAAALAALAALAVRTAHHQRTDLRRARAAVANTSDSPARLRALLTRCRRSSLRHSLRSLVARPFRHRRALRLGAVPLTVLPDDRADAFALPGRPGRIVATTGMLSALPGPERAALLAHERAHLDGRHYLFLAVAEYAAVCHPALRLLRPALSYHLERWADESAARAVGDRALTARAVGRAALAASRAPRPHRPRLAPAAHTGPVPRRVAALLSPRTAQPAPGRAFAALALAACLALTASATLDATTDLHQTVESAQGATQR